MQTDPYAWFSALAEPLCLCLIEGTGWDQALQIYGATPLGGVDSTLRSLVMQSKLESGADDSGDESLLLGMVCYGNVILAIEPNGWHANVPGLLRRMSATGRCASIYSNVEGTLAFAYAVDGDLVVYEEPHARITPLPGKESFWNQAWGAETFRDGRARSSALLEVVSEIFGLEVSADIESTLLKSFRLDPLDTLPDGEDWDY